MKTSGVLLLTNAELRSRGLRGQQATVTDLRTGRKYNIFWGGAPNTHTDFSPMTPADTEIMRSISNGWNWKVRPVVLHIAGLNLAAAVHHFPHGSIIGGRPGLPNKSNTRPAGGWPIGGHMCMYFKDSTGGTNGMREMAAEAFRLAKSNNSIIVSNTTTPVDTGDIQIGSRVKIRAGSTWFTGQKIPGWVFNKTFTVDELNTSTGRVVLDKSGIRSPIHVNNLIQV